MTYFWQLVRIQFWAFFIIFYKIMFLTAKKLPKNETQGTQHNIRLQQGDQGEKKKLWCQFW